LHAVSPPVNYIGGSTMVKARDSKKEGKKEPTKTLKEKKAAKKEKKEANLRKG
jgi:hypothetical protein